MVYDMNFRCYYESGNTTNHQRYLELNEIPKWIEAYLYTHPEVKSITVKIWPNNGKADPPA